MLISPDRRYRDSLAAAISEFEAATGRGDGGLTSPLLAHDLMFAQYVSGLNRDAVLNGRYQWWWCATADYEWIGRVTLLRQRHGHRIEIAIRPSRRGQGHLTRIITAVTPIARGMGVDLATLIVLVPKSDESAHAELLALGATPHRRFAATYYFPLPRDQR